MKKFVFCTVIVILAGCQPPATTPPGSGGTGTSTPGPGTPDSPAVLTADELVANVETHYLKRVTVKGKIDRLFVFPNGTKAQLDLANTGGKTISCDFEAWTEGQAAKGDNVEVTGNVVTKFGQIINLRSCTLVKQK
jgi:hypothetical protein